MEKDPFKEYLIESEPDRARRGYAWSTAIGLQAVDGLKTSEYLRNTAIQNIEGSISLEEARNLIDSYYEENPGHLSEDERTEEADKVSLRIAELLSEIEGSISLEEARNLIDSYYEENPGHLSEDERTEEADKVSLRIAELLSEIAFSFSPNEYISIHRKLFQGIYEHAGKIRDYNITKKEWVLEGESVIYGSASELQATLEKRVGIRRRIRYIRKCFGTTSHP